MSWAEAAGSHLNAHAIAHISELRASLRTRPAEQGVTDTIEKVGGRRPRTFAAFVAEESFSFAGQPASA